MVRAAQAQDKVITADMTGWGPDDKRKFVPWFLQARELPASNQREKKALKKTTAKPSQGFSAEERAAMKERAQELKTEARQNASRAEGEKAVQAAIAAMAEPDRAIAKRLHALVAKSAPALAPKTWYGMPAYAKDGNVVCFFQCAGKFKARYGTFGFSDKARLDDGAMWPTSYAITKLTPSDEAKLVALIKRAVG